MHVIFPGTRILIQIDTFPFLLFNPGIKPKSWASGLLPLQIFLLLCLFGCPAISCNHGLSVSPCNSTLFCFMYQVPKTFAIEFAGLSNHFVIRKWPSLFLRILRSVKQPCQLSFELCVCTVSYSIFLLLICFSLYI